MSRCLANVKLIHSKVKILVKKIQIHEKPINSVNMSQRIARIFLVINLKKVALQLKFKWIAMFPLAIWPWPYYAILALSIVTILVIYLTCRSLRRSKSTAGDSEIADTETKCPTSVEVMLNLMKNDYTRKPLRRKYSLGLARSPLSSIFSPNMPKPSRTSLRSRVDRYKPSKVHFMDTIPETICWLN